MLISLTVQQREEDPEGRQTGTFRYKFDQDEVLIGRDRATDVRLPHPAVSLVHLRLLRKRGRVWAVDMSSKNGTYLDGLRLEPERGAALDEGSRLAVGPFEIVFGPPRVAGQPLTEPADTARLAREIVLEFLGPSGGSQPFLEVENSAEQGQKLTLPALGGVRVVGRGEGCNLRLSDADASRRHFEVQNKGEVVELRDLGSKNGVEVDGERITGVVELKDGDCLRVGHTRLRFCDPAERMLHRLELENRDEAPREAQPPAEEQQPAPGTEETPPDNEEPVHETPLEDSSSDVAPSSWMASDVALPTPDAPVLEEKIAAPAPVGNFLLTLLAALLVLGALVGVVYLLWGLS
jgi:pSer/pThr/pTyr-binding forkhead associated (FHA) protein